MIERLQVETVEPLARSIVYEALSLALHPPAREIWRLLVSQKVNAAQACSFITDSLLEPDACDEVREAASGLDGRMKAWSDSLPDWPAFQRDQERLFGHTARGIVCPYETEYGQDGLFGLPHRLANLRGLYDAFGLTVRQDERERPDHISCELEFMQFLCVKEAWSLEKEDRVMQRETALAARLFLKEHLGRFGRALGRQLVRHDPESFFGTTGLLLCDFLTLECHRLEVEAGPLTLPLRSPRDDDVPMACGRGDLVELES